MIVEISPNVFHLSRAVHRFPLSGAFHNSNLYLFPFSILSLCSFTYLCAVTLLLSHIVLYSPFVAAAAAAPNEFYIFIAPSLACEFPWFVHVNCGSPLVRTHLHFLYSCRFVTSIAAHATPFPHFFFCHLSSPPSAAHPRKVCSIPLMHLEKSMLLYFYKNYKNITFEENLYLWDRLTLSW